MILTVHNVDMLLKQLGVVKIMKLIVNGVQSVTLKWIGLPGTVQTMEMIMILKIAIVALILFAHGVISFLVGCAIDRYFEDKEDKDAD